MPSYLISGITGKLGEEIAKIYLHHGASVVGISRNENAQWELEQRINNPNLTLYSGDIRDKSLLKFISNKHEVLRVYHCAALKHVDRACIRPIEYIGVNELGTQAICETFENVVVVSSDKACEPSGTYGASKLNSEAIALSYGNPVVRLGNLIESNGNIMRLFELSLPKCTCQGMTRFFEHTDVVAKFITNVKTVGVHILKMRSARLGDIFKAFTPVFEETFSFRKDEKMHETLFAANEGPVWEGFDAYYIGNQPPHGYAKLKRGVAYLSFANKFWTVEEIKKWKK